MDESSTFSLISSDKVPSNLAATEIILGMLISKLDKIHPGLQEELRDDFSQLSRRMRAESVTPIRDLDEVQSVAENVLRPYSG